MKELGPRALGHAAGRSLLAMCTGVRRQDIVKDALSRYALLCITYWVEER